MSKRPCSVGASSALLALLVILVAAPGCASRCKQSVPPGRGMIFSCCGGRGTGSWYWTGTECVPNPHCQCDARPAKPQWWSEEQCRAAHEGCPTAAPAAPP